jgi:diguanylate cyclase (GGDEF)-like protein
MEPLIKHLVGITGHRDHSMLDVSVVSALYDLVGAVQVRALEIFRFRDDWYVRPRVWVQNGRVVESEEALGGDHGGELISSFPTLVACISEHINSAEETTADGDFMLYRNYQSLLDYSERDSLTGLLNRKTFDEKFSKMVAGGMPEEETFDQIDSERRQHADVQEQWLAVVDIDHFKRVNDQFGHLYGDEVLILVANLLRLSFRTQDRVFRFGGEEFVILLRSTTRDDARKIFERFRSNVEKHDFPQVGQVTVSLGFASINQSETPVVILGHADQALYYAKANGRNRVFNYEELVTSGSLQSQIVQASAEFFFDAPDDAAS